MFPCATDGDVPADAVADLEMTPRHVTRSRYCDVPYSMLPDEWDGESAPGDDGTPSQATPGMFSYVRPWFVDDSASSAPPLSPSPPPPRPPTTRSS